MKPIDYAGTVWSIAYTSWRTGEEKHAFEPTWARATGFVRTYADPDTEVVLIGGGQQTYVGTYTSRWVYKEM